MEANFVEIGKQMANGLFSELGRMFLYGLLILLAWGAIRNGFGIGMDRTDKDKWHRSGFKVMIDGGTGVHYLSDGKGGLIIRVDANGKPIIGG